MDVPPPAEIVIVTAARLPEAPGARAFSSVTLEADDLADAQRIDEALKQAPGVSLFRRSGSGQANPTIQGLTLRSGAPSGAGRALVTLDGAPQNDPFGGWVIWGALPPETISRAVIVRGAGAGPYGAGALTGAVDLAERDANGAVLSAEVGEYGRHRVAGVAQAGDGALDFMLAGASEHADGWVPVREGRGAGDVPLALDALSGVARVQARGDDLAFAARISGYAEDRSAGLAGADSTASGASASVALASAPRVRGMSWRVQAWARSSDLANSSVAVSADRNTATPAADQYATPATGWGVNAAARWTQATSGFELGFDTRAAGGETRELFRYMAGDYTRTRLAGGETFIAGVYGEAWRQIGAWLITGGARVDNWRAFDGVRVERDRANNAIVLDVTPEDAEETVPTARLGVRRDWDAFYVRSAAYTGFRPPTLNELHRPFRVGNDVTEANPLLKPERLTGIDAAIGAEGDAFAWEFGLFATRLEDPVTNVTRGAGPGNFPPGVFVPAGGAYRVRENAGRIDASGVEAQARGDAGERFAWRAAMNYTHARVDGGASAPQLTDLRPAQSPVWTLTAGASWRVTDAFTLDADLTHESARFEDDLNSRKLDAATRLDLAASQDIGAATLFVALDNATDEAIATGVTADGITSYDAPRTLRAGVRISWD